MHLRIISDEALMKRITAGEQEALDHLYERHRPLLHKMIGQMVHDTGDTEEVLQDVFMMIWNRARTYDATRGKPLGWIIRLARCRAIDRLRRTRRYREHCTPWNGCPGEIPAMDRTIPGAETPATTRDLRRHLTDIIDGLPPEQRNVVILTFFEDLSQRQIASHTGIPLGTIKTRLALALRKLLQTAGHLRQELDPA